MMKIGFLYLLTLSLWNCGGGVVHRSGDADSVVCSGVDSIAYDTDMSSYMCFFSTDKYDRQELLNTMEMLRGTLLDGTYSFWPVVRSGRPVAELKTSNDKLLDSLSRVRVLGFEPWQTLQRRVVDFQRRSFALDELINSGIEDPRTLYRSEQVMQDSVTRRCAEVLATGGDDFVDNTRRCMREVLRREWQGEEELRYSVELMEKGLREPDSILNARIDLLKTIHNRINGLNHAANGIYSDSTGLSWFEPEFRKLFDSMRLVGWEEP